MRRSATAIMILLLVAPVSGAGGARAAGPGITYSGRLTEPDGTPVAGPVDLEVRFFDALAGGAALGPGALAFPGTALAQGVFHVDLVLTGAEWQALLGAPDAPMWVEVTDATHGKTFPRQQLAVMPYALRVPIDGTTIQYDVNGRLTAVVSGGNPALGAAAGAPAGALFVDAGGKIGVGTATPAARLQVAGGDVLVDNNRGLLARDSGGTARALIALDASNNVQVGAPAGTASTVVGSPSAVKLRTGGADRLTVDAAGNVGIGTTSPSAPLTVAGTANSTTALFQGNNDTVVAIGTNAAGGNTSRAALEFDDVTAANWSIVNHSSHNSANPRLSFVAGNINSATENVTFQAGGNVGIGTASPDSKLSIAATTGTSVLVLGDDSADPSSPITGVDISLAKNGSGSSGTGLSASVQGTATTGTVPSIAGVYGYSAQSGPGSTVTNAYGGYFKVDSLVGTLTNRYGVYIGAGAGAATNDYALYSAASGKSYFAGNVGIGTTTPTAKLQVQGGQAAGTLVNNTGNTIDWNQGNIQTTNTAAGTVTFAAGSMLDGATYTLILNNGTGGTYTLASSDITTWKCMPVCSSAHVTVSAGKDTVLSLLKAGTTAYVSWIAGF